MSVQELDNLLKAFRDQQSRIEKSYEISVVTPMFGGSSAAGEVDKEAPIRSASIRGHLRFWWRATRGAAFVDAAKLREAEIAIFGDTEHPSKVKIWVESMDDSEQKENQRLNKKEQFSAPKYAYVLFPFGRNKQFDKAVYPYKFKLFVRYDALDQTELSLLKQEVNAALWAWINFGGVGARTRRGCGTLFCQQFSPCLHKVRTGDDLKRWFKTSLNDYKLDLLPAGASRDWPTLSGTIEPLPSHRTDNNVAWAEVVSVYRAFRRRANKGRKERIDRNGKVYKVPGRSRWPEADSIRRLTGMAEPDHTEPLTLPFNGNDIAFPCAQFGLPIITEFQNEEYRRSDPNEREPYKTQLVPQGKERLASPIIMKTIAVSNDKGFGGYVVLLQPKLKSLNLIIDNNLKSEHVEEVKERLSEHSIEEQHIYPRFKINGKTTTSAIEAFLNSKEVRKWKETNLCKR
ncbi:type III-B CRISPR module RAMP protein Cmr1 [Paenibacillus popilliae]|nr:type III-B CRISPR module RAMP protein Cmr1 [Paenibacillus popilliae]